MTDEEIDLSALPDDELVKQMHDDLYDGLAEEIAEGTNLLLGRGWAADRVLNEALEEHEPDILGMSALLTTTMPYMKVVIDELKDKGLRDKYIVLVGGAPLNEEFGKAVGADAYCRDAAVAAETAQALVLAKRSAG